MSRNHRLLILGILILAALAPIASLGDLRARVAVLLTLWGAAHAFYLGAAWVATRPVRAPGPGGDRPCPGGGLPGGGLPGVARPGDSRVSLGIVVGVALLARLLVLPTAPTLSEDVYRYLWDGRLVANGINPFPHPPNDPALGRFHDDLLGRLNHAEVPTIYPPAAQLLFGAIARVEPTPLAWKLALLPLEAALWLALLHLLRRRGIPGERILLFAWNPLVIIESYGSGHLDLAAAAFLTLALALDEARRPASAGISFALAAMTKYTPLLLVPYFLRRRAFLLLAVAAGVSALLFVPFADAGRSLWTGLTTYVASWEFNGSLYPVLRDVLKSKEAARIVLAAALLVAGIAISLRARSAAGAAAALYTAYLLASPTVFPWYLVPLVALLPLYPNPGALVFSGLVALSYVSLSAYRLTGVWSLPAWVPLTEYGVSAAVYFAAAWARWPRPRPVAWMSESTPT